MAEEQWSSVAVIIGRLYAMVSLSGKKNSLGLLGSLCSAKGFRDNEFLWFGQPTVEMRRKGGVGTKKYEWESLRCLSSQHVGR